MTYTITADNATKITLAPASVLEEVLQNVAMIISTPRNTAPLARDIGLSNRFIDMPIPVAEAVLMAEVLDAIEQYEPRAVVKNVSFERDERTGKTIPRLEVEIENDGE